MVTIDALASSHTDLKRAMAFIIEEMERLLPELERPRRMEDGTIQVPGVYLEILKQAVRLRRLPADDPRALLVPEEVKMAFGAKNPGSIEWSSSFAWWKGIDSSNVDVAEEDIRRVYGVFGDDADEYISYWKRAFSDIFEEMISSRRVMAIYDARNQYLRGTYWHGTPLIWFTPQKMEALFKDKLPHLDPHLRLDLYGSIFKEIPDRIRSAEGLREEFPEIYADAERIAEEAEQQLRDM